MPEWQTLLSALRKHDVDVSGRDMPRPVGGGDISAAWRVKANDHSVFLMSGSKDSYDMFVAEAEGLGTGLCAVSFREPAGP
jgi:fructosamine-3-kinase